MKESKMVKKLKEKIMDNYMTSVIKAYKGKINFTDIVCYDYKRVLLPMGSSEEDPDNLYRRKSILSNCKKLDITEKRIIAGYYALYFLKPFSYGYVSIGYSETNILKSIHERLNDSSYELEEYIKVYGLPEIYLLEEFNVGEKINKEKFKYFRENLRPEIGREKIISLSPRNEFLLLARRECVKELAIWKGSLEDLKMIHDEYKNCLYLLEMDCGKEYIGCSQEVVKRIKTHTYKSTQESKDYNLYEEFEVDLSKVKVFIFKYSTYFGTLKENEQKLIRFLCPELNVQV